MQACADDLGVGCVPECGDDPDLMHHYARQSYYFPLVRHLDSTDQEYGFLQCPRSPSTYDFGSSGWWTLYGFYIASFVVLGVFCVYKLIRESITSKRKKKMRRNGSAASTWASNNELDDDLDVVTDDDNNVQAGYRDDYFGFFAYLVLWAMSIGMHIFLLLVIFDIYGLFVFTLCDDSAKAYCDQQRIDNPRLNPSWREGMVCGSGCLFSWRWTSGFDLSWPYLTNPGGGQQIYVIFITAWHITLAWNVLLKATESKVRTFFRIRHDLSNATYVLMIKPREPEISIEADRNSVVRKIISWFDYKMERLFGEPRVHAMCKVRTSMNSSTEEKAIVFQCQHYLFNIGSNLYNKATIAPPETYRAAKEMIGGLSTAQAASRRQMIGPNHIPVSPQPLHLNIWEEVFNYFFFYQYFCLIVWIGFIYWTMGLFILSVVCLSVGIKTFNKWKGQSAVAMMARHDADVQCFRGGELSEISAGDLVPGDVVAVQPGDLITFDGVVVDGRCVIDESSLTGEPTPVPKTYVDSIDRPYNKDATDCKGVTLFAGTKCESATTGTQHQGTDAASVAGLKNYCTAVVLATGVSTEKGALVKSILYPPRLSFKFDEHWRVVFMLLLGYGVVAFMLSLMFLGFELVAWWYGVFTTSQVMSPLIPATFVNNQAIGSQRLRKKQIYCVNLSRIYACGKVKYFCFDKTGTMTKDGLEFHGVDPMVAKNSDEARSTNPGQPDVDFVFGDELLTGDSLHSAESGLVGEFVGMCHSLDFIPPPASDPVGEQRIIGNEVDCRMFEASLFTKIGDKEGSNSEMTLRSPTGAVYHVVRRFEFDRNTMTMSVIVRSGESGGTLRVMTKGSYESMREVCAVGSLPNNFDTRSSQLAKEGNYVLGMSFKAYDGPSDLMEADRAQCEKDQTPIGLLVFRNDLKETTAEAIQSLKEGAIRCVMVTGDNALTAIKIARESRLTVAPRLLMGSVEGSKDNGHDRTVEWSDTETGEIVVLDNADGELMTSLENGDTELVITGAVFDVLKSVSIKAEDMISDGTFLLENHEDSTQPGETALAVKTNSQMRDYLRYARIFARTKPQQKVEVVQFHMQLGITGMCGDGANDAGALRAAHVGLALASGSQEATIVSSFTTSNSSLNAIVDMVRFGRASLMTATAGYKNLIMYGQLTCLVSYFQYDLGVLMSEMWWFFVDAAVNVGMTFAMMLAKPAKRLRASRPTSKLLGLEMVFSICSLSLLAMIMMIALVAVLFQQDWFVCREFDSNLVPQEAWFQKADNYEAASLACLGFFLYWTNGAVFNFGFEYRRSWIRNWVLVVYWVLGLIIMTFLTLAPPNDLSCLFRLNCGDKSLLNRFRELGRLGVTNVPGIAPAGCPCNEQLIPDLFPNDSRCYLDDPPDGCLCEAEYISCNNNQFQQRFHHNIIPMNFRWVILGLSLTYMALAFVIEGVWIVGPGRQWLRKQKRKKSTAKKVLV
eukprot:GHVN01034162.1.p1 GENE.GHVN01034162.1~~GHVN01034162.1.p1  ORF type:complete len:1669 (-),score=175.90 GHVN01034162.1:2684-7063(-)